MPPEHDAVLLPPPSSVRPLRRPLIGLALCFTLGTAAGLLLPTALEVVLLPALGCSMLAVLPLRRVSPLFVFAAAFFVGWFNAALSARSPSCRELAALMARPQEYVSLVGVVCDDPVIAPGWRPGEQLRTFSFRVEGLRRAGGWERARGEVAVRWMARADGRDVRYGDRWSLAGLLTWHGAAERRDEILPGYSLDVDVPAAQFLSGDHGSRILAWCLRARHRSFEILGWGLEDDPEEVGLLRALMLGYRQEMSDRLYRAFATTGTLHVVAISGMHVAIFSLLLVAFLKATGLSRQYWVWYLAPIVILYTIGTGLCPSAVRACVMALIFWSAPTVQRRPDGPVSLAAAALAILAFAPAQLLDLGFLFSFIAVAGLMTVYPRLMNPVRPWLEEDPWRLQAPPFWKRLAWSGVREAASVCAASIASWLITTPLTAYCFNLVSPVALLSNLLVIPLSFAVLMSGVLALLSGSFSVVLAEVFNHASRVFIDWMLAWVEWTARVPFSYSYVKAPAVAGIVFWYALLVLWLLARGAARRWVLAAAAVAVAVLAVCHLRDDRIEVLVLDVGQGNAAFVNVPGEGDLLVDAGSRNCARGIVRQLHREGVDRLRALVVSHGDAEHIGAAAEILEAVPVSEVWCSASAGRSSVCRQLFAEARRQGIPVQRLRRGAAGVLAGGSEWEVLHPDGEIAYRRGDEGSLVLRVARGACSILFMGDAEATAEAAILRSRLEPSASVLVVGRHAAADTCAAEWLDAVAPSVALISVGADNLLGAPDADVLARLAERDIAVRRTDEGGGVRVRLEEPGSSWGVSSLSPTR